MHSRTMTTIAAVCLTGVLLSGPDAVARGVAGFHGGGRDTFHMEGHFGGQHHDKDRDRADKDRADRDRSDRQRGDMERREMERGDMERRDMGHWYRSAGFGDSTRRSSSTDGQWHVESKFR